MICALVLAAGQSRRMGTQKLLLPYAGSTVIGHIVDRIAESVVDRIYVVVGSDQAAVTDALSGRSVEVVPNPEPDSAMLASVRCGLRALPAGCRAVLVALGDQPGITPDLVDALVAAFDSSAKGMAVPVHDGRRGHPLLFAIDYRDSVLTEYDEIGLRGLLRDHLDDVLEVAVPWPAAVADIDYPEDYRRELERLQPGERPPRSPGNTRQTWRTDT
jgi:molybdenum cofactor cytidylyltransferase